MAISGIHQEEQKFFWISAPSSKVVLGLPFAISRPQDSWIAAALRMFTVWYQSP